MNESKHFEIIKISIYAIALPLFCILYFIWKSNMDGTFDEYNILTKKVIITSGYIIKAEKVEEELEDDRTIRVRHGYEFGYTFSARNGEILKSIGFQNDSLPLNKKITEIPYPIKIEYVLKNPKINRVKGLKENNSNLWSWFRHKVLMNVLVFMFSSIFGYSIFINRYKELNRKTAANKC